MIQTLLDNDVNDSSSSYASGDDSITITCQCGFFFGSPYICRGDSVHTNKNFISLLLSLHT